MQNRRHKDNAERQRAYRERKRNDNKSVTPFQAYLAAIGVSESYVKLMKRVINVDSNYHARFASGEITIHAAALELGLINKRASISTKDVDDAVDVLLKHYTADQVLVALVRRDAFAHWDETEVSEAEQA